MSVATALASLTRGSVWIWRALAWSALAVVVACASLVVALRYWYLPNIDSYRDEIAAVVSRTAKLRLSVARISATWEGLRPRVQLEGVSVYDREGRRALGLDRVDGTISWRSLVTFRPHFHSLDIYQPLLEVRRNASGVLSVAGIALDPERTSTGFSDWVLQQPEIEVHRAALTWVDEFRGAPPLELTGMTAQLRNHGNSHRFGLRALPPAALAGPIDVRGEMRGRDLERFSEWKGKFFVDVERVDLGAWAAWLPMPGRIARGAGALRSWITWDGKAVSEAVADVKLASVRARFREDLPELELDSLAGRLGWKTVPSGFEVSATRLALNAGAASLEPADFRVSVVTDKDGVRQGQAHADTLALAPLAVLADRLPIDDALRRDLVAISPRGTLHDFVLKWKGEWPQVASYSVRGRFEGLAFSRWGVLPAVSGLSGNIDGNHKGGTLHLAGERATIELPDLFPSAFALDTVTAQIAWTRSRERLEVKLSGVSFANADAAGNLFGTYRSAPGRPGEVDLTGNLSRADARSVPRYIPLTVARNSRPWFERAFVAGHSNDVRFRLKGRLDEFPYAQDKRGVFHVAAKISGGTLDFAERWPRIENIEGDLQFRGSRMEFSARAGKIGNVKLSKVEGEIADLKSKPETLTISGEAEGTTPDFLMFIARSPVADMTERFTDTVQAQGPGRLSLKLTLPLPQLASSKVAGTYQFNGNHVVFGRDLPPIEQASGRIEFTELGVRTPGITGTFLGGPVTGAGTTQRDGFRAALQGRVNADHLRRAGGPEWMQNLRGSTEWRGTLTVRKKVPEVVVESNLHGLAASLPAPFSKTAAESVPLRIERRSTGAQQDRLSVSYGDVVRAELARRNDGRQMIVERGVVRLGGGDAGEPDRPGVWLRGTLKRVDFDEWLAFGRTDEADGGFTLSGADLKLGQVDFFGRRFTDLAFAMAPQRDATQFSFVGREIEGVATWRSEGKGRLTARLKKLTLTASDPKPSAAAAKPTGNRPRDLPALDVVVDQFQHGQKQLGRLELNAVHHDRDWRIERLRLTNPDSTVTAEGVWQGWQTQPRTQLKVRMDVSDAGRTLTRWGYPAGVRRGIAKIDGLLSWAGSPHDFDYPTLAGQLAVEAANGQFVKLEPGIGKLLGILSLQSIPRRMTLDFRDVFSEGFSFDTITGALKIESGVATTDNFRLQGPSARVTMAGQVDLARETQKLRVRVTPHLSDSVSIAGALIGGPVAGVAAFLAQKILKDPLEQLVAFEYNVTGAWSDPQVTKVERPPLPPAEGTP